MLRKVDFSVIIKELNQAGYTQSALAKETGYTSVNINHLANGRVKDPAWPLGDYLIRKHAEVFRATP